MAMSGVEVPSILTTSISDMVALVSEPEEDEGGIDFVIQTDCDEHSSQKIPQTTNSVGESPSRKAGRTLFGRRRSNQESPVSSKFSSFCL